MKKYNELTDEQKKKIDALAKSHMLKSLLIGLKFTALLLLTNAIVILFDIFYVHNQAFVVLGGIMNAISLFSVMHRDNVAERDRVEVELKKIVE
jgi:hypothetical protein